MMPFAKRVAKAIQQAVVCERIGIMVAGLEVPHAHLHLIPIQSLGDLTFARAKPASNDDLAKIAEKIRKFL